jgi:hypothetical protein
VSYPFWGYEEQRRGTTRVMLDADVNPEVLLRLHRLARELRLTDQILSVDLDTLSIVMDGQAPAWTSLDGDHVTFAWKKMPSPTGRLELAVWLGTNAHELGHVLFSPRRDSLLMRRVLEAEQLVMPRLAMLHNIVEDQRQERLMLARFGPWRGYLTAALGHHLKGRNDLAWLLLAGRTWLPANVRSQAKADFAAVQGAWLAEEVAQLVGRYQQLTDPGELDSDEAFEILSRLHELLGKHMPELPWVCTVGYGPGDPDTSSPNADSVPLSADDPAADPDGQGRDAAGDTAGDDGKDGHGKDGDASKGDQGAGGGAGGSQAGNAPGGSDKPIDRMRKDLKAGARKQLEEDATADELDSILDALEEARDAAGDVEGLPPAGRMMPATDRAHRLHHEVSDALLDLKDQSEPGWVKRVDSGRLNVRRLVDPNVDYEELFDRYEPGQMDASEMEVALLIDVSGSMASHTRALAEATWAIQQAVDDLDGRCMVLAYDAGPCKVLSQPSERPDDRMFLPGAGGGTEPSAAIREAWRVLSESTATNRMLVILTDGQWYGASGDALIRAMTEQGVITVLAGLGISLGDALHGCSIGADINDPTELARLFRRVAAERIAARL